MIDIYNLNWEKDNLEIPQNIKNWLLDNSSLTAKLKRIYPYFGVSIIKESLININNIAYIKREVHLCNDKTKLVYAISIIPTHCTNLINLGDKPLGEILFNHGKRLQIMVAKSGNLWGRKSIFSFQNQEVIVCEFFLDELFKKS